MASIKKAGTITLTGYAPGTTNMYGATPISKTVTVSKAPLTVTGMTLVSMLVMLCRL